MKFLLETSGLSFDQRTGLSTYGRVNVHNGETARHFYLIPHETIYTRTAVPHTAEVEQRIKQTCEDFMIPIIQLLLTE